MSNWVSSKLNGYTGDCGGIAIMNFMAEHGYPELRGAVINSCMNAPRPYQIWNETHRRQTMHRSGGLLVQDGIQAFEDMTDGRYTARLYVADTIGYLTYLLEVASQLTKIISNNPLIIYFDAGRAYVPGAEELLKSWENHIRKGDVIQIGPRSGYGNFFDLIDQVGRCIVDFIRPGYVEDSLHYVYVTGISDGRLDFVDTDGKEKSADILNRGRSQMKPYKGNDDSWGPYTITDVLVPYPSDST